MTMLQTMASKTTELNKHFGESQQNQIQQGLTNLL